MNSLIDKIRLAPLTIITGASNIGKSYLLERFFMKTSESNKNVSYVTYVNPTEWSNIWWKSIDKIDTYLRNLLSKWCKEIFNDIDFDINNIDFYKTGTGIRYAVPIIASIMIDSGIVFMEHPEIFLDNKGKTELGKLFAQIVNDERRLIVETHSDYLIDGIRLYVKENKIDPKTISFNHLSKEKNEKGDKILWQLL